MRMKTGGCGGLSKYTFGLSLLVFGFSKKCLDLYLAKRPRDHEVFICCFCLGFLNARQIAQRRVATNPAKRKIILIRNPLLEVGGSPKAAITNSRNAMPKRIA